MSISVLTVEDSVLIRRIINDVVKEMDGVELAGTARNGAVALKMMAEKRPNIITLDVEMPVLNGIETLEAIRKQSNIPVIMLSTKNDEQTILTALEMGAQDFLQKPAHLRENREVFKNELETRIKALARKEDARETAAAQSKEIIVKDERTSFPNHITALVIGASTGGPRALTQLIHSLPREVPFPIFIVQHMPESFLTSFAERLHTLTSIPVLEAKEGMRVENGKVYLAPGGRHMVVQNNTIRLLDTDKLHGVKPAVDPLFESAAKEYKENVLAVLLTGMGKDGARGSVEVRKQGGYVIAQNKESCVVYGMPKHAYEAGGVNKLLSLEEIISVMLETMKV